MTEAQKPTVGRIVQVRASPNGQGEELIVPAIITRVWSDTVVNVMVLPDEGTPHCKSSLVLAAPGELLHAQWQWPTVTP